MKFYLSTAAPDVFSEEALSVRVNNIRKKRVQINGLPPMVNTPDERQIMELNALAAKPPFSHIYKPRKFDPL